ncbi:DUF6511 domain-containing protein [Magnetofaba australis]|nr:DUF6511 domain-containing protein [Magnetofaba australis]
MFGKILKQHPGHVLIWLLGAVRATPADFILEATDMVDATELEKTAMAATLPMLGEYVGSIGMHRPLADYSKQEVLALVEVVITAYQDFMANARPHSKEIPF